MQPFKAVLALANGAGIEISAILSLPRATSTAPEHQTGPAAVRAHVLPLDPISSAGWYRRASSAASEGHFTKDSALLHNHLARLC